MPKQRSQSPVELVFGAKQALIVLLLLGAMLAGAYALGLEAGYKRAQAGRSSPLDTLGGAVRGIVDDADLAPRPEARGSTASPGSAVEAAPPRVKPAPVVAQGQEPVAARSAEEGSGPAAPPQTSPPPVEPPGPLADYSTFRCC